MIRNSVISEGTEVHGTVSHSILSGGVFVAEGAEIHDSVIMSDAYVGRGARIYYAIVDSDAVIEDGAVVGSPDGDRDHITVIPAGARVPATGALARGATPMTAASEAVRV